MTDVWTPQSNNNLWNNVNNWSLLRAPLETDNVTVANTPSPLIAGSATTHNLTITARSVTIGGTAANQQSTLVVSGSITNNGSILINPGASNFDTKLECDLAGTLTQAQLSGGGRIDLSDSLHNFIESGPNGVTLSSDNLIDGAGQLGNGSAIRLDNQAAGIIEATQPNNQLIINMSQKATNEGTIQAVTGSAGLTIYRTTIDSLGGGQINAAGANVSLIGATLIGGTLQTGGGGIIQTMDNANVIDDVTNNGSIHVNDATTLTLKGNITNSLGAITMLAGNDQTYLAVDITGATLIGPGLITLTDSDHNVITGSGNNSVLNNLANVISGAGMIGGNGLVVNNAGVITATGVNNALTIETGGVLTNNGVLSATGPAGLEITNTTVNGVGGGQIIANAPNAHVQLTAAHLIGGTLRTTGAGAEIEIEGQGSIFEGTTTNLVNAGTVSLGANTALQLWGTIKNTGTFSLEGTSGAGATLRAGAIGATLTGGGTVTMGDSSANSLSGMGQSNFTNQDNTISGAGSILDMTFTNGGTIDATSASAALQIHTQKTVTNNGVLEANGGTLNVLDAVTGTGTAVITSGGTMSFSAAFAENVAFQGAGQLTLSLAYAGTISGLAVGDSVDLGWLAYKSSYVPVWSSGTLMIEDSSSGNAVVASLKLSGGYSSGDFSLSSTNGKTLITAVGPSIASDFNGDGKSDQIFENGSTFTEWQSTGNGFTSNAFVNSVGAGWSLAGIGDFNGDGNGDLIFQNGGTYTEWQSSGNSFTQNVAVFSVGSGWNLAGTGDFNGDGKSDLIFQNGATFTEWQSTGNSFTPNVYVNSVGAGWKLAGVGDFNGDGKSDLIWQNGGTFTEWQATAGGTSNSFAQNVYVNNVGAGWTLAGVGDFNGDGKSDLIWQNGGTFTEWQSSGNGFTPNVVVDTLGAGWSVAAVGDFNSDGLSDILFRNTNGTFSEWQSNGTGFTTNVYVNSTVGNAWTLEYSPTGASGTPGAPAGLAASTAMSSGSSAGSVSGTMTTDLTIGALNQQSSLAPDPNQPFGIHNS